MPNNAPLTVQYYEDAAGEWRWRAKAGNERTVADSGEGYINRNDCLDMIATLFPDAFVVEGKAVDE